MLQSPCSPLACSTIQVQDELHTPALPSKTLRAPESSQPRDRLPRVAFEAKLLDFSDTGRQRLGSFFVGAVIQFIGATLRSHPMQE
jgi:hypothetical protein